MFSDNHIQIASLADTPALVQLLNSAYRGEASQQGWTSESHLIAGEVRTDEATVKKVITDAGSVMLKYVDDGGDLIGCVNLQDHDGRIYLGMFSVSPVLQGGGIGKKILHAAEEYARQQKCAAIYMTVISVRKELIDWYKRHGYEETGEVKSFEEDGLSGKHLQQLEFIVLEKKI
ncbi:MAG: GNAT family N-acetyltransferase [Ferruginibacter sp.]